MSHHESKRQDPDTETGTEGTLSHSREHLSPRRADEQEFPEQERQVTPLVEAGERKGDESGNGGTERQGP